jgi:hypothetical protein
VADGDLEASVERATPEQVMAARERGTVLPIGVAEGIRELARIPTVGRGLRFARREDVWTVVLEPTKETRKLIESGRLVLTNTGNTGRRLAQARDPNTGRLVENIKLRDAPVTGGGATAASVATAGAAIAWQAMAIATQQHYLVEISGKLSAIQRGVTEIIQRQMEANAADLTSTIEALTLLERHLAGGDPVDANDRQSVAQWHKQARSVHLAAVDRARAVLADSGQDPAHAVPDLMLADRAAQVAARCSATLLRLPFETEEKRLTAFWHYGDLADDALATIAELVGTLDAKLRQALVEWRKYDSGRPQSLPKKAYNTTLGRVTPRVGPARPRFDGLRPLPPNQKQWIRDRVRIARGGREAVSATVVIDESGARLLPN